MVWCSLPLLQVEAIKFIWQELPLEFQKLPYFTEVITTRNRGLHQHSEGYRVQNEPVLKGFKTFIALAQSF